MFIDLCLFSLIVTHIEIFFCDIKGRTGFQFKHSRGESKLCHLLAVQLWLDKLI